MSLKEDIESIAKEEGYCCPEEFVNHCVFYRAWSFSILGAYLARAYNRHYSDIYIYSHCRPMVRSRIYPYRIRKWNGYAKQKGYDNAIQMFKEIAKKTLIQASIELDKIPQAELRCMMNECSLIPVNRIRRRRMLYFGVKYLSTAKKWQRAAELLGYRNARDMIKNWPHSIDRLAEAIGVHPQAVYYMKRKIK